MDPLLAFQLGTATGAVIAALAFELGFRHARRKFVAQEVTRIIDRVRVDSTPSVREVEDICDDEEVERYLDYIERVSQAKRLLGRSH